ncbi:LysR family transcriptional regulator [Spirillospora sp. NPDC029432]|uniref:helix-turn-helix domain-containing protein n=1 Tax=Spirillospora sp. NPDC029432 TaxID=3154599 RepID=UPI003456F6A9
MRTSGAARQRDLPPWTEESHFSRTAERPHISQAHASQATRRQERRISARLYDRTSRRVRTSPPAGEHPYVRPWSCSTKVPGIRDTGCRGSLGG